MPFLRQPGSKWVQLGKSWGVKLREFVCSAMAFPRSAICCQVSWLTSLCSSWFPLSTWARPGLGWDRRLLLELSELCCSKIDETGSFATVIGALRAWFASLVCELGLRAWFARLVCEIVGVKDNSRKARVFSCLLFKKKKKKKNWRT